MKTLKDFEDRKLNHKELNKLHGGYGRCAPLEFEYRCVININGVVSEPGLACARTAEQAQQQIKKYYSQIAYRYVEVNCVISPTTI